MGQVLVASRKSRSYTNRIPRATRFENEAFAALNKPRSSKTSRLRHVHEITIRAPIWFERSLVKGFWKIWETGAHANSFSALALACQGAWLRRSPKS